MKKRLFATILTLITAIACAPDIDPEYVVDDGIKETYPDEDGQVTLSIGLESNISEYINVQYSTINIDGRGRSGNFSTYPSQSWSAYPKEGVVKVAFKAVQINDWPKSVKDLPEKITFKLWASVQTPTSGRKIVWCGLNEVEMESIETLKNHTLRAINKGLPGLPKGTADKYHVEFEVSLDSHGGYAVTPKWVKGKLFKEDKAS